MHHPFDDNSAANHHSSLDDLIQSLGLDPHQHSNSQSADTFDLSHFSLDWENPHHSVNLDYTGTSDIVHLSSHPLAQSVAFDVGYPGSLSELRTELQIGDAIEDFATLPNSSSSLDATHYEGSYSLHHPHEIAYSSEQNLHCASQSDRGAIEPNDSNAVEIYSSGNVYWHSGGQVGKVDGHEFYRGGHLIGYLGADLNIYDSDKKCIGYVTPSGNAYTPDDKLFAKGGSDGTALWAAATLVFNTCSRT